MAVAPPFVNLVAHQTGLNPAVVEAWVRSEGGPAGNPLNIGPGRNYGDTASAARATAQLLNSSHYYSGIRDAIRSGNPGGEIAAIKASPWDAGHYGNGVLDRTWAAVGGGPLPARPQPAGAGRVPAQAGGGGAPNLAALLNFNNQIQGLSYAPLLADAPAAARLTPPQASFAPQSFKVGTPVLNLSSVGGEHETMGLAGYPAHDYFAPSGSATVAPVNGRVIKLSGHDPRVGPVAGAHGPFGWSVYIRGDDGRTYFLTHLGSRAVRDGQTVRAGQPIGTVGDYARYGTPSHVHMGVNG